MAHAGSALPPLMESSTFDEEVTASEAVRLLEPASPPEVVEKESRATAGSVNRQPVSIEQSREAISADRPEALQLPQSPPQTANPQLSPASQATSLQLSLLPKSGAEQTPQLSLAPNRGLNRARPQALGSRPKKSHGQEYDDDDDDAIISSDDDINDDMNNGDNGDITLTKNDVEILSVDSQTLRVENINGSNAEIEQRKYVQEIIDTCLQHDDDDDNRGDFEMSHRPIGEIGVVAEITARAGQPGGKARDTSLRQAGLPLKRGADGDVLVHGAGVRQPSTDVLEDQQGPEDVRATSSFVAGARALPAAWRSQDTDEDYPAPGGGALASL